MHLIKRDEVKMALAAKGILMIYGNVDSSMVVYVRDALAIAEANEVEDLIVQIQSDGGSVTAGLHIYDMLRAIPMASRTGLVMGYARSVAAVILQACETRIATRHARILVHDISPDPEEVSITILTDPKRLKELVDHVQKGQQYIDDIFITRTKRTLEEIRVVCDDCADMTSGEALAFGLIDKVRD